uniref:F-box domain-containing protein n=1 Tax=Megaselia scalaris TaxID=36166 RepID=T1GYT1_MEGSC
MTEQNTQFLDLPEEIIRHFLSFCDLKTLKAISETNNYLCALTTEYIVEKCVFPLCLSNPTLRQYKNYKILHIPDYAINLDDKRLQPKNIYTDRNCLFNDKKHTILRYINSSRTLQNVYVYTDLSLDMDLNSHQTYDTFIKKVISNLRKFDELYTGHPNPYELFNTVVQHYPIMRDLSIYTRWTPSSSPDETDWAGSKFTGNFAFDKLCCVNINSRFFGDLLIKNKGHLKELDIVGTEFYYSHLPQQLRVLYYRKASKDDCCKTLENLLENQKNLEKISLKKTHISKKILKNLNNNRRLFDVELVCSFAPDLEFTDFTFFSRITLLCLFFYNVNDINVFWNILTNLSATQELKMFDYDLSGKVDFYKDTTEKFKDKKLILEDLKSLTISGLHLSNTLSQILCAENLKKCDLYWENRDYFREFLRNVRFLTVTNIISFEDFKVICAYDKVRELSVKVMELTGEFIEFITNEIFHLETLEINIKGWTEEDIKKNLKEILDISSEDGVPLKWAIIIHVVSRVHSNYITFALIYISSYGLGYVVASHAGESKQLRKENIAKQGLEYTDYDTEMKWTPTQNKMDRRR